MGSIKVRRYIFGDRKYVGPAILVVVGLALIIAGRVFAEPSSLPPASRDALPEVSEYKDTAPLGNAVLTEPLWDAFLSQASFGVPQGPLAIATTEITIESHRFPVGSTTRVSVRIAGLTDGLSGFDLTLEGSGGLRVSDIQLPPYGLAAVSFDGGQVRIRAVDINQAVEGALGPFQLFSFGLLAEGRGVHSINRVPGTPLRLDDDAGGSLIPQTNFMPGEYQVTGHLEIGIKFVVNLSTTRSVAQITSAMQAIESAMKAKIDALLSTAPATTRSPLAYELKVARTGPTTIQIYPDLYLAVDTTRSNAVIRSVVGGLFDDLKTEFRTAAAGDPQTSIESWHVHRPGGPSDEMEP